MSVSDSLPCHAGMAPFSRPCSTVRICAFLSASSTTGADLTIKATGYQWKWGYDYVKGEGEGLGFVSTLDTSQRNLSEEGKPAGNDYLLKVDNPLVVPINKKVRIITTADDVIHSWSVPAFGVKQDAIPGFVRDTWFLADKAGDYYGIDRKSVV